MYNSFHYQLCKVGFQLHMLQLFGTSHPCLVGTAVKFPYDIVSFEFSQHPELLIHVYWVKLRQQNREVVR
jgi:hypothetical protein